MTALNTKLLPPSVGQTHRDLIGGGPFIPDSISSAPTSICHWWGLRVNVLIHLVMKSAVYWLIGGVLEVMVILLLDLKLLCDGSSFSVFLVAGGSLLTEVFSYTYRADSVGNFASSVLLRSAQCR